MTHEIQKQFDAHGIRRIKVGGFDVDGVLRGKYMSLDKFWSSVEKGFGFCDVIFGWDIADQLYDNAKVTGWKTGYPDAQARIDTSTFRVLPYAPDTAHFLVDFHLPDGTPHPACPRNLLKRVDAQARQQGYIAKFAAEFEFWIFRETPESLYEKNFDNLQPLSPGMFGYSWVREAQHQDLLHEILDTFDAYNIPIEGLHTETGPGVWEACLCYDDVLAAADKAALFKTTLKQICFRHGLSVTFMAKWNMSLPGSSGHLHQSLWSVDGKNNVFASSDGGLSEIGKQYLGCMVALAPELTAFYSPFINTYKRYVPGVWAPLNASWGVENRTCAARVIPGPGASAARIEWRQTASDINPYVAMATCLASGLYGIEHKSVLPSETKGDATADAKAPSLPTTLRQAVGLLQKSTTAPQVLSKAFVDHYTRTRNWECRQHEQSAGVGTDDQDLQPVSEWELRRYFEAV